MIENGLTNLVETASRPKRAFGRSLRDFREDRFLSEHGLWPAEETLLEAAALGQPCLIEWARPSEATEENRIRAGLLRFLLLGGDDQAPVHEKRLEVHGAYIDGDVDLEGVSTTRSLWLFKCKINGALIGRDARLGVVNLQGSLVRSLLCDQAQISGGVHLSEGFEADGPVQFRGANIVGPFVCTNGKFMNPEAEALDCRGARISDNVLLTQEFAAEGLVTFARAEIGGQFSCDGGTFKNPGTAPRQPGEEHFVAAYALDFHDAEIRTVLRIGSGTSNAQRVFIQGSLNLEGVRTDSFADHPGSWPVEGITRADGSSVPCVIVLDGFHYLRFAKGVEIDVQVREKWLMRQPPDHLGASFRVQPFEQLAAVMRSMGRMAEAREIGYFEQRSRLRMPVGEKERYNPLKWLSWATRWLFLEKTLGYGYRPQRMVILALAVLLFCGLIYQKAGDQNLFVPTNSLVYRDAELKNSCYVDGKPVWTSIICPLRRIAPEYTMFNPYIFSLDVIVPLVNLRQEEDWQPLHAPMTFSLFGFEVETPPYFVRSVVWAETLFAWVWSLSLIGVGLSMMRARQTAGR